MTEEWRQVLGFEGLYDVSNQGRVRSWMNNRRTPLKEPRIKKLYINKGGYACTTLMKQGTRYFCRVSVLVCEAWYGARPEGLVVRHKNGNPRDNQLKNLCWGTHSENNGVDKVLHGTSNRGARHGMAKLTEQDIYDIRNMPGTQREIAKKYGVSQQRIFYIKSRKTWAWLP